jgi:hypothetical protein
MNATKSTTTQNVAIASTPAAALVTLLSAIRAMWPSLMPWPPSVDAGICALLGGLLMAAPVVSRKIAVWRDPKKLERKAALDMVADLITELPPEAVANAAHGTQEIIAFATRKDRPARETPEARKRTWDVFATRLKAEAVAIRAAEEANHGTH